MRLIGRGRMKLIIDIPEEIYKASKIIDVQDVDVVQIPLEVIANGTPIPDNATNGDVFKTVFPKGADLLFGVNWWYEPYQKGSK